MTRHPPVYKRGPILFGTKAETLDALENQLTIFSIPEFLWLRVSDWTARTDEHLRHVQNIFRDDRIIIRSSALGEDGAHQGFAGKYLSVGGVETADVLAIERAVRDVIESYPVSDGGTDTGENQIIIQRMISDVSMSGVIFTRDMRTGAPYYVVNYDDETGKTDTVTAGTQYGNRTLAIHRDAIEAVRSPRFRALVEAVRELEEAIPDTVLDIEFALGRDLMPYLFQVRRVTTMSRWRLGIDARIKREISELDGFLEDQFAPAAGIHGHQSVYSQMSDWNPAEMISQAPRRLAYSLYRDLITNGAWADARQEMGYQVPSGRGLMRSLAGHPYIDVRLSFNSFLPAELPDEISEKVVTMWLEQLISRPDLHDKVEFEIATTVFSVDFDGRVAETLRDILTAKEIRTFRECLRGLTNRILSDGLAPALARIDQLRGSRPSLDALTKVEGIRNAIETCRTYGIIPFAVLARHAFAARAILNGFVDRGILSGDDIASCFSGIRTIASDLVDDMAAANRGRLPIDTFLERYGHLRPGTYEICSPRYDQNLSLFEAPLSSEPVHLPGHDIKLPSTSSLVRMDAVLEVAGIDMDAAALLAHARDAVISREHAKFVFTRTVSDILEAIAAHGASMGLDREDLSHIDIKVLLESKDGTSAEERSRNYRRLAADGRASQDLASAIRLPIVLHDRAALHVVPFQVSQPNFVTNKAVSGPCIRLCNGTAPERNIAGHIVLIESADPGFDWIFGHGILALVTKFGGVNSHMTIRAAEFDLPAAIGCGDQIFDRLARASSAELDCLKGTITPINIAE